MSNRRKIILFCTNYWRTARILPAIDQLSKTHDIVICSMGSGNLRAVNDNKFAENVKQYLREKIYDPRFKIYANRVDNQPTGGSLWYESDISDLLNELPLDNVDCIIYDDSRSCGHQIPKIIFEPFYDHVKGKIPVIANIHGNVDDERLRKFVAMEQGKIYDKLFIYGGYDRSRLAPYDIDDHIVEVGIPANDAIHSMSKDPATSGHVLIVLNRVDFDGMRTTPEDINNMRLQKLWETYKLPVVFKVKPPPRVITTYEKGSEIRALQDLLAVVMQKYPGTLDPMMEIVITEDDFDEDWLLLNSKCVISYGSTMCFKAIQADIPTVIARELGNVANFENYHGTLALSDDYFEVLDNWEEKKQDRVSFLENTLRGSLDFNSTELYVNSVYGVINEWNQKDSNQ